MSFPGSCARYVHTRFESLQGEDDQPKTYLFSIYTDISDAMGALSIRVETLQTVMEWEENQFTAVSLMTKTLTLLTVELVRDVIVVPISTLKEEWVQGEMARHARAA